MTKKIPNQKTPPPEEPPKTDFLMAKKTEDEETANIKFLTAEEVKEFYQSRPKRPN